MYAAHAGDMRRLRVILLLHNAFIYGPKLELLAWRHCGIHVLDIYFTILLLYAITTWVLAGVASALAAWRRSGLGILPFGVGAGIFSHSYQFVVAFLRRTLAFGAYVSSVLARLSSISFSLAAGRYAYLRYPRCRLRAPLLARILPTRARSRLPVSCHSQPYLQILPPHTTFKPLCGAARTPLRGAAAPPLNDCASGRGIPPTVPATFSSGRQDGDACQERRARQQRLRASLLCCGRGGRAVFFCGMSCSRCMLTLFLHLTTVTVSAVGLWTLLDVCMGGACASRHRVNSVPAPGRRSSFWTAMVLPWPLCSSRLQYYLFNVCAAWLLRRVAGVSVCGAGRDGGASSALLPLSGRSAWR